MNSPFHGGLCTVHFGPNPGNERENSLPNGARGAKIWWCKGGIPTDPGAWPWFADDTASPYAHNVPEPASGESLTIAYRAQYIDKNLRPGPFSDPATATITV